MSSSLDLLQAVFWDMDGTLVDTEPYWIAAEHELVQAHGGTWSQEQAHGLVGQALTFSAGVLQEAGVKLSVEEIIDQLIHRVVEQTRRSIPWRPGARELLNSLHEAGVSNALVTMSYKPLAEAIVSALPAGQMEFIVTGDMVEQGKPHPEAYLRAFEQMSEIRAALGGDSLDKARCVAIEDSIPGTASAAASGLVTLAVPHFTPLPESEQWHLVSTLEGLDASKLQRFLTQEHAI